MPALKRRNVADLISWLYQKRSVKTVTKDKHNWARAVYVAQLYHDTAQVADERERQRERSNKSRPTLEQTIACKNLEHQCLPYDGVWDFLHNAAVHLGEHVAIFVWTNITPEPTFRFGSTSPAVVLRLIATMENADIATNGIIKIEKKSILYVLTNRRAFNSKRYECLVCNKLFQRDGQHRCVDAVHFNREARFRCCACKKTFSSETSLDNHEEKCDKETCSDCGKLYSLSDKREIEEHLCDEKWCRACKMIVLSSHLCCLEPINIPRLTTDDGDENMDAASLNHHQIIAFDVETDQTGTKHVAILICAERSTDGMKKTFFGTDCLERFCKWLFHPQHTNFTVVAHNLSGFDSAFLMQYLHQSMLNPEVTLRGTKIISLTLPEFKIRCIDFLLFCPMPLAKIPGALGITGAKKGYFPHAFTNPDNYSYSGGIVPAHYYSPEQMKASEKAAFHLWYEEQRETSFNFKETLVEYCENDVHILLKSVLKYRNLFLELSDGVDPLTCATLPQACFTTFRARHLKPGLFGILPVGGYNSGESNSAMARMWIAYETRFDEAHVQTTWDNGELRVRNYKVDAATSERFLEFYGCYYHGCLKCYQRNWYNKTVGRTFGQLQDETMKRHAVLEHYKPVTSIYECEWKALRRRPEVQAFLSTLNFRDPLRPIIYGGRCEVFKVLTTANSVNEILMYDFVSMYPQICRDMPMPKKHPKTYTCNFPEASIWLEKLGIAHVRLHTPMNLLIPLIPMHVKCGPSKKLVFSLCFLCATEKIPPPCQHNEDDRYVEGTYITPILKLALEHGYRLEQKDIYGLWLYDESTTDLFASYVNAFYAHKVAASGFPADVVTEQEKLEYITLLKSRDNIELHASDIVRNDAKRCLLKLLLNNLWGKTCQASNPKRTLITDDRLQFIRTVCSPEHENVQWLPIEGGAKMLIQYQLREHALNPPPFSNPVYGEFVTGYAHMKLWNAMRDVKFDNVIYCDTDSVAFVHPRNTATGIEHITGNALGFLESVIAPPQTISEFVATGSKVYSMELDVGDGTKSACVKVKGMRLTADAEHQLNHQMFKSLVANVRDKVEVTYPINFVRDPNLAEIRTKPQPKTLRPTLDKRFYYGFKSVPWGWKVNLP